MALKGTIKDFGIADIFQLIGHQAKNGMLILRDGVDEVRVFFQGGAVIRAESSTRPKAMLLGSMLVNAEVITRSELETALQEQARTLRKIGTILVELGMVRDKEVKEFARLQMTETVFRLFMWQSGTYEFEQTDVSEHTDVEPIRAETILMEGLRMIDEWPMIKRKLPSYSVIAERAKPLPEAQRPDTGDLDFDVFNVDPEAAAQAAAKAAVDIGPHERLVYSLVDDSRDVQKIIYLSRLGEFETCRTLLGLVSEGYLRLVEKVPATIDLQQLPSDTDQVRPSKNRGLQLATYGLIAVAFVLLLRGFDGEQLGLAWGRTLRYRPAIAQRHLAQSQLRVIERALEVYKLQHGKYPESLDLLLEELLVRERDLSFPYQQRYFYSASNGGYVLLPPLR
jgi:hypothetical protein